MPQQQICASVTQQSDICTDALTATAVLKDLKLRCSKWMPGLENLFDSSHSHDEHL